MTLGERIKSARERLRPKMTQARLATLLKVTDKAVSNWERDIDKPDVDRLMPMAANLKVSVVWILSGTTNPPPPDQDWNALAEALPGPQRATLRAVADTLAAQAKIDKAS